MKRKFELAGEAETVAFAGQLAVQCQSGLLLGLSGTLGAGKTFFVREFARQKGVDAERVLSPTFTLCNEYATTPKIYHLDLYRVRDEDEFFGLGIDEMCDGNSIVFIEWSDRFADALPPTRLTIHIELVSETARRFKLSSTNPAIVSIIENL